MVLTLYAKQRILQHYSEGSKTSTRIKKLLEDEGVYVSRVTVWKFLRHFEETNCLSRKEGSGRPTKITPQVKAFVEETMQKDDETTAFQLHKKLTDNGFSISISTILRCRKELGWTFRGKSRPSHCNIGLAYVSCLLLYVQEVPTASLSVLLIKRSAWHGQSNT